MRIVLTLVILALGGGGYALLGLLREPPPASTPVTTVPVVETVTVQGQSIVHEVTVNGTVQPRTETMLVAEVTGRVIKVHDSFVDGGFVEKGELLFRVDTSIYEADVAAAEAELARSAAQLERELAQAVLARKEWDRYGEGDADTLVLREPQMAEARASVAAAKAALVRANVNLSRAEVRAPFTGRLRGRDVDEGQYLMAGVAIGRLYATESAEIRLAIAPDDLAYLDLPLAGPVVDDSLSPQVTLTISIGGKTHQWQARIVRTEGEVDRSRFIHAIALVEDPYDRRQQRDGPPLMIGMFVEAKIEGRRAENVVVVPRRALRQGQTLRVVDGDNRLRIRAVEVLRLLPETVLISSGLQDGDQVCVSNLELFTDGMLVQPVPLSGEGE